MDALPTIFCPQCDRYVGHKLMCSCGWMRPPQPPIGHIHGLDVPIESPPLIVSGRGMVVFGFGARLDDSGGLIAIDLATGKPRWTYTERCAAVSGGAALAPDGEAVLFGDAVGSLHRVRLADGGADWHEPRALGSLIEHAPVMPAQRTESACVVGTSKGVIAWVDWRAQGNAVPRAQSIHDARISAPPVPLGGGRYLIAALERRPGQRDGGGVYVVDPIQAPRRIFEAEAGIYAAPVLIDPGTVVVLDAKGQANRIALNGAKPSTPWKGDGVRSAPVLRDGVLYVAHGKRLTALRADTFRPVWNEPFECDHSLRAPAFVRGLLVCADTVGRVHAVDALTGRPVWDAPFNAEVDKPAREIDSTHPGPVAAVLGGVAEHEGALWFGAGNGRIYSLPFWHTNSAWARDQARREGRWRDAAALTLLTAKDAPLADLQAAEVEATEMLTKAEQYADAARIYRDQAPPKLRRAAESFEKAAATAAAPARMWAEAAACWLRIPELERALRCQREAALARGSPWLEISDLSVSLKVGTVSILRFLVRNVGPALARNPSISLLAGSDFGHCHPDGRAELGDEVWSAELRDIAPMKAGELMMTLNATWEDDAGNESRQQFKHRVIAAEATQPATVIHIERLVSGINNEGDVGYQRNEAAMGGSALKPEPLADASDDAARDILLLGPPSPSRRPPEYQPAQIDGVTLVAFAGAFDLPFECALPGGIGRVSLRLRCELVAGASGALLRQFGAGAGQVDTRALRIELERDVTAAVGLWAAQEKLGSLLTPNAVTREAVLEAMRSLLDARLSPAGVRALLVHSLQRLPT